MKIVGAIAVLLALGTTVFGQPQSKIIETYERKEMPRPFIARWIKELFGPSLGEVQKLQLRSDGTFQYSYRNRDRTCGFMNHDAGGTWKKVNNHLVLLPYSLGSTPWSELLIEKGRLYASVDSLKDKTWALKMKRP